MTNPPAVVWGLRGCMVLVAIAALWVAVIALLGTPPFHRWFAQLGALGNHTGDTRYRNAVVLRIGGSGPALSHTFRVGFAWDLTWRYDCSKLPKRTGMLHVDVVDNGGYGTITAVNVQGSGGTRTQHYDTPGTYTLMIYSSCAYSVDVIDEPFLRKPAATP